jgi:guanine deaminase
MNDHLVVRGGILLDAGGHRGEPADVLIERNVIRELGRPGLPVPEGARELDARDRLLVPGLVNAHTHAHGALAKGLVPDRVVLETFLASVAATTSGRALDDKYLSAVLSAIEMVRKGCTAAYDMFVEYPATTPEGVYAVGRAYADVGMRAVIAPMLADRTMWEALPGLADALPEAARAAVERVRTTPAEASVAACREILHGWPFDRDRVRPAVGPTIPLHCSDAFLTACGALAAEFDVGLQTHLAETKTQALLARVKYGGRSLTAHLGDLGLLTPRLSAAHAIWLDGDDIGRLADAGVSVAHNPLSNLRLGSGIAPVRQMCARGVRVGIGTDSASTSDTQNMFEATRLAAYLSHLVSPVPEDWLSVSEAWDMATVGSAAVLGRGDRIGRIAPGYCADIVFLDLANIGYVPLHDVTLQLVNGESGAAIDKVVIDGRLVLDGGRLLTLDEAKVRADAERAAERLRAANAESRAFARSLERYVAAFCVAHGRTDGEMGGP